MSKIIGIDLGTTNSCVAVLEGGNPVVIPNETGGRTTPSVVAFAKNGERLVGETAKRQAVTNSFRTISSIKRKMGSDSTVRIDGKEYKPQEISALILMKLKQDAENYLGETVTDAVITVPAYFNDVQRQATRDAGRIAGLTVRRIINEPTAAALAYGLDNGQSQKILVFDLGGGTFDVSIIEIGDNLIEVLATSGDNHLGGDDFDERIALHITKNFKKQEKIDLTKDTVAMERIREEAERVKKELSQSETAHINLPFITQTKDGAKNLEMVIIRKEFEELTDDLIQRTKIPVQDAMESAGLKMQDLTKVLLVGGSTRIPAVQNMIRNLTGLEPSRNINPDECVALGASIQAAKFGNELIPGSNASELILMDVTPLSLSIETIGGVANHLIERNTTIPTRQSKIFTTAANFQTSVDIKVYQGERKFTRDNKLIGNFQLNGIKRALAGVPQIEVTFDIDANGIVQVSAKDLGTGKMQQITITSSSNLTEEEIQKAMHDAQNYNAADNDRTEVIQIYTEAERYAKCVETALNEQKKTLDRRTRKEIKAELSQLKKLLAKTNADTITDRQAGEILEEKDKLENIARILDVL